MPGDGKPTSTCESCQKSIFLQEGKWFHLHNSNRRCDDSVPNSVMATPAGLLAAVGSPITSEGVRLLKLLRESIDSMELAATNVLASEARMNEAKTNMETKLKIYDECRADLTDNRQRVRDRRRALEKYFRDNPLDEPIVPVYAEESKVELGREG